MRREDAIEVRRQAIFEAAAQLIRETRSTDFSMPVLAKRAGLSNATTYNIIGSKPTVLYHLLDSCLEDLLTIARLNDQRGMSEDNVLRAAVTAIDYFVKDAEFYRPLMKHMLGVADVGTRPSFMSKALRYWRILLDQSGGRADSDPGSDRADLAQLIHIIFVGAINSWVYGDLDAVSMRRVVKDSITLVLKGATRSSS
jgi:AcrR family transcriptional regulator